MAITNKPVTYVPRPMPTLDGGTQLYLQQELASVSQSIKTITAQLAVIVSILNSHGLS